MIITIIKIQSQWPITRKYLGTFVNKCYSSLNVNIQTFSKS